jgi:hypothetical protein
VKQRFADDVAFAAFAGFGSYQTFGTLTGSADPNNDFPCRVLLLLHNDENLDHEDGCTHAGQVYRIAGGRSATLVEGFVAARAFAVDGYIERRPFDAAEGDDVCTAECLGPGPVLHEAACWNGVDFTAGLDEVAAALERPASDHKVHACDIKAQSGRSFAVSVKRREVGTDPVRGASGQRSPAANPDASCFSTRAKTKTPVQKRTS